MVIDPRVWLLWGAALSLPPMLGRNPFPLVACLIVALTVRYAASGVGGAEWGKLIRIATVFAGIGVIFNLVTYHGGDRAFGEIPGWIPIIGGPLTLNAVVYGVLSGLALVTLVVIWSTVAQHLDWTDLVRLSPPAVTGIAISGSVALTLVPKTIEAFTDIKDAQAIRGFRMRGARDLVPLTAPLLTLGLERAVTMSEALESRGFGGPQEAETRSLVGPIAIMLALTAFAVSAFLIASGHAIGGLAVLVAGGGAGVAAARAQKPADDWRPTRYRPVIFRASDRWLAITVAVSLIALLGIDRIDAGALAYEPYPVIAVPDVSLAAIAAIALLLCPLLAPATGRR
jgi:energy-coupling factor transport system permease protein